MAFTLAELDAQMKAAKQANETRYQDILSGYNNQFTALTQQQAAQNQALLGGYDERYARIMAELGNLGNTDQASIASNYAKQKGATTQGLISRGLGNTTVVDAAQRGLSRDQQRALNEAAEAVSKTKTAYEQTLSADKLAALKAAQTEQLQLQQSLRNQILQFMERKTDEYPDTGLYVQLAQMQAQQEAAQRAAMLSGGGGRAGGYNPNSGSNPQDPTGFLSRVRANNLGGGLDLYPGGAAGRASDAAKGVGGGLLGGGGGYGAALGGGGGGAFGFTAPSAGTLSAMNGSPNAANAMMNRGGGGGGGGGFVAPTGVFGGGSNMGAVGAFDGSPVAQQGAMNQFAAAIQQAIGGGRMPTEFGGGGPGANWSTPTWGAANPESFLGGAAGAGGGQYLQALGNLGSYGRAPTAGAGGAGSNWSARAFAPNSTAGLPAMGALPGAANYNDLLSQFGAGTAAGMAGFGSALGGAGAFMSKNGFNQGSVFNPITAEGMFPQTPDTFTPKTPTQPTQPSLPSAGLYSPSGQFYAYGANNVPWGTVGGDWYGVMPEQYFGMNVHPSWGTGVVTEGQKYRVPIPQHGGYQSWSSIFG